MTGQYTNMHANGLDRIRAFVKNIKQRRSVRRFSGTPTPKAVIRAAIEAAASGPSGANCQPWRFVAISDPFVKSEVRIIAENEERDVLNQDWSSDIKQMIRRYRRSDEKPYLEDAAWLIAVYVSKKTPVSDEGGAPSAYETESIAISLGIMLSALNEAGVGTLVHVPVAQDYLGEVCGRADDEQLFMLVLAGEPAPDNGASPPLQKKSFHTVAQFIEGDGS